ncbi:MAG: hypothetical protein DLM67_26000 [Candidatus Nephthysia bennettiae]|nr:MAG: hypothetical protein DLM67_26000 [Candidatus Dormibacteraeota bacterium]
MTWFRAAARRHLRTLRAITLQLGLAFGIYLQDLTGFDPKPGSIPGTDALMAFVNGVAYFGYGLAALAIIIGALTFMLARGAGNVLAGGVGIAFFLVGFLGGAVIAASQTMVNGGIHLGGLVK